MTEKDREPFKLTIPRGKTFFDKVVWGMVSSLQGGAREEKPREVLPGRRNKSADVKAPNNSDISKN